MNFAMRVLSFVALLGLALTTLSQYRPDWAARFNLDWWNLPELHEQVRRARQESAELDSQGGPLVTRMMGKHAVIQELRAGRLTLLGAASRFRDLNALGGGSPFDLGSFFSGATDEERLCRQVIRWAASAASAESPGAEEETIRRLEAELDDLLARNGGKLRLCA